MANLDMAQDSIVLDLEDDRPIAVRRKRRSSSAASLVPRTNTTTNNNDPIPSFKRNNGMNTPPATPQRTKKRVRFSDPGPDINSVESFSPCSTGLTPFVRRTSLSASPSSSRRHSTPSNQRWNLALDSSPIPASGILQFAPLRQVLEGRVKRRLRRNRLSEEVHIIEVEKRCENKNRKTEIERLREELRMRDEEMRVLREETQERDMHHETGTSVLILEEKNGSSVGAGQGNHFKEDQIRSLERQIASLKAELQLSEASETSANWTLAARDPFHHSELEDGNDTFMPNFSSDFAADADMTDILLSTPGPSHSRQRSFPSPPSTMPNTPNKHHTETADTDEEKENLERQLQCLREDVRNLVERLAAKLGAFNTATTSNTNEEATTTYDLSDLTALDEALDALLTTLAVSQSSAIESSERFEALVTELSSLSPESTSSPNDPEATIAHLKTTFRSARLELERMLPGETEAGFSPPSAVLPVLLEKLRVLVARVQAQEADIDQYHSLEMSLRQQLSSRVDVNSALETSLAQTIAKREEAEAHSRDLEAELGDRDASIAKLTAALHSYREEVASLESLVTSLESTHTSALTTLGSEMQAQHEQQAQESSSALLTAQVEKDTLTAQNEGNEILLAELEKCLATATSHSESLETQLATLKRQRDEASRTQGSALAVRDARVSELRREIERINASLRDAHGTVLTLRNEKTALARDNHSLVEEKELLEQSHVELGKEKEKLLSRTEALKAQVAAEKTRGRMVIDAMRAQLDRALVTGRGYLDGRSGATPESTPVKATTARVSVQPQGPAEGSSSAQLDGEEAIVVAAPKMRLLDSGLARRSSGKGKKRRRYDSGLGFLEEDDDGQEVPL